MKRIVASLAPAVFVLLSCGCWNGRILFSFEQPYWAVQGEDWRGRAALLRAALPRGYFPRIVVTGSPDDPAARLAGEIARGHYRTVVVGPLLSLQWRDYAPRYPQTRFVLIGAERAQDQPPNVVLLLYDRTSAFRAAGFAAGVSVRNEAGGQILASLATRIGILLSASSEIAPEESDAFAAGVGEALDGARPAVQVLPLPVDKASVKSTVDQMRQAGVEIFLFGMGSLDPWCLESLQGSGSCAVVADWASSGPFPPQVFLSVEEDVAGGIAHALSLMAPGLREVSGPVHIVRGRARPVPEEAAARVAGG